MILDLSYISVRLTHYYSDIDSWKCITGAFITEVIEYSCMPVSQWQCSFHLKAALPLAEKLVSSLGHLRGYERIQACCWVLFPWNTEIMFVPFSSEGPIKLIRVTYMIIHVNTDFQGHLVHSRQKCNSDFLVWYLCTKTMLNPINQVISWLMNENWS